MSYKENYPLKHYFKLTLIGTAYTTILVFLSRVFQFLPLTLSLITLIYAGVSDGLILFSIYKKLYKHPSLLKGLTLPLLLTIFLIYYGFFPFSSDSNPQLFLILFYVFHIPLTIALEILPIIIPKKIREKSHKVLN
jgi:ABC-type arginine/histidine transport system permease subunit